jgi:DNA-binding IclR family transcriptional regulator
VEKRPALPAYSLRNAVPPLKTRCSKTLHSLYGFLAEPDELELRLARLPKSTAHRTAQQMIKLGWLNYRDGQYSLGTRMFEFAGLSPVRTELRETALRFLEDLYEATHATVHLGVMDGRERTARAR